MSRHELFVRPFKLMRSVAVKRYMEDAGYSTAVCFSCGNAVDALRSVGVDVVGISPNGEYEARRWMSPAEVHRHFPLFFDATSGHLPMGVMRDVAGIFKSDILDVPDEIWLPTGSGETLVCMKMAFPDISIHAVYDINDATAYNDGAPLNGLVRALACTVDGIGVDEGWC